MRNSLYRKLTTNRENYITTLSRLFDYGTTAYAKRPALTFVDGSQKYTYGEFRAKSLELMHLFSRYGLNAGDRIAILSQNMPNWTVSLFSIVSFGRVAVPILPDSSENEVTNILNHSECKAIFISQRMLPKLNEEVKRKMTLVIDIDTLEIIYKDNSAFTCDGWGKEPSPDDLAMIIYTSGTSGKAKGVMLSHRNFCVNVMSSWYSFRISKKDVFLSILPMAHTYELSIGMLYPFAMGARVAYLQKVPTPSILLATLKQIRPTAMLSVPLIIEKIYKSSVIPAINGSKFLQFLQKHVSWLLYSLIGIKLRKTFGGRLKFFGIGGAKLDPTVEAFLKKTGFPYAIGYGLTETAPLICAAPPGKTAVGSTGKAVPGIQGKPADINPETGEGEITVKGPNVMLGYYKDYERTVSVLSHDGWFRTGDLACCDGKGRYFVRGRLGSLIVGASGENIYPEEIENVINSMDGISESLVIERDGQLIALVQFNDNLIDWNLEGKDKFIEDIEARKKAVLEFVNARVSKFMKIRSVEVQKEPFTKTATHKIKRFLYTKGDKPDSGEPSI